MDGKRLAEVLLANGDYICDETQCTNITFVDNLDDCEFVNEVEIDGYKFIIGMSKVEEK